MHGRNIWLRKRGALKKGVLRVLTESFHDPANAHCDFDRVAGDFSRPASLGGLEDGRGSLRRFSETLRTPLECGKGAERKMTVKQRSHEEWLAELNDAVRRYRTGLADSRANNKLTYDEALALIRKLGFTTGEAVRLLRPAGR